MKMTHTQNGMIGTAHGPEEYILCKGFHTLKEIQESKPFLSKYPWIVSDKYNQELPNVSGNTKDPQECPYMLQQEVPISDA